MLRAMISFMISVLPGSHFVNSVDLALKVGEKVLLSRLIGLN